jgi:hypothetical protein
MNISNTQTRPVRKSGVRRLAGSFLTNDEPTKPTQESKLPLAQLVPSVSEIKIAEEALRPRVVIRRGKKVRAEKPYAKPRTTRQRYNLSRRDVASLLDKPGVADALPSTVCTQYQAVAAGNISLDELAVKHRVSRIAMEAIVEGWESDIVRQTCALFPKFQPYSSQPEHDSDGERSENQSENAQDREIAKTGGTSIGGRIVSVGTKASGKPKKLSDFERSGRLRETVCGPDHDRSGSHVSEEDDYGEESGA